MSDEGEWNRRQVLSTLPIAALGPTTVGTGLNGVETRGLWSNRQLAQSTDEQRATSATDFQQQAKLTPQDVETFDTFGESVSVDGNTALVGAKNDEDANGDSAGAAYVFTRDGGGWSQQDRLAPTDGDKFDTFGSSVSLDGDTALVGASGDEDPNGSIAGSAYVFTRSGGSWSQQAKLTANDGDSVDLFGYSVSVDGDSALVGAEQDEDPNGDRAGSAYVFTRSGGTWSQQDKLAPTDADADDAFGISTTLAGDTALVGATQDEDPNGNAAGAAYVFTRTSGTWSQQTKLTPIDGDDSDQFGYSLELDGDTALIGARFDEDPNGEKAGAAYVFTRNSGTWSQQTTLTPSDGDDKDRFGTSVSLDSDRALVGASGDEDPNGENAGAAYVFTRSSGTWSQQDKFAPDDGDSEDFFGVSASLAGDTALVGANEDEDPGGDTAGSAYVFAGSTGQAATFAVTIDRTNAPVTAGNRLDVTATITNTGTQSGSKTVTLSVGGTQRDSTTLSLNGGQSKTVTLSWQTADGDSGTYTAEVATPDQSVTTSVSVTQGGTSVVDQYDRNDDGTIDIGELGQAAGDFAQGNLGITDLGKVAAAFAGS